MSTAPRTPPGDITLPPLVLTCRPAWRISFLFSATSLMVIGIAGLADRFRAGADDAIPIALSAVLIMVGSGCAYFAARYCLARLSLDEQGFRLVGPLSHDEVRWNAVVRWESRTAPIGPDVVRIVHGPGERRLSIPLIYHDSHALVIGLGQGHFPDY
ncbi:MAG: hypothetical protein O7A63_05810 [Acidobacteria bacterium]|nr:hypothetical protein [Acidobacteriota bacterium]